ncbi:MAG: hypothetical protein IJ828_11855, partial [Treponema sp.]|nr:hypothetical protein [Treponema sp.]
MLIPNGKKNIFIVHFPDKLWQSTRTARMTPLNMFIARKIDEHIKKAYSLYLCNSQFTAGWLKKSWNVDDN